MLLEVKNLSVDFILGTQAIHAVQGVDLHVKPRETVVIAGESGSGKTVTALAITKILPPNARMRAGAVLFAGADLARMDEQQLSLIRGSKIAYCFQEPASYLNPVYTIAEQISEAIIRHQRLSRPRALKFAERLLADVRIPDPARVLASYPHQLSGGMNQRVFIAMGLACKPQLLIADEPTTALDVTIEARILKLLVELKAEYGFALLFITHNLSIARKIAERVYVMYQGKVVEEGPTQRIFTDPVHAHTRELINAYQKIGTI